MLLSVALTTSPTFLEPARARPSDRSVHEMTDQDMAAWWDSNRLTEDDKIEWCAAAIDGLVAAPLADTIPPDLRDEWLTPAEPEIARDGVDEPPPIRVYEMSEEMVGFIDANC
jgi:hypothetical protein